MFTLLISPQGRTSEDTCNLYKRDRDEGVPDLGLWVVLLLIPIAEEDEEEAEEVEGENPQSPNGAPTENSKFKLH